MPVDLILGTNNVGPHGKVSTLPQLEAVLDRFAADGNRVLDTAYLYPAGFPGESEAFLGETLSTPRIAAYGFVIDTKVRSFEDGAHTAPEIAKSVRLSFARLGVDKVRTLYLHAPDRTVPFEESHRAMTELYKEGKFERFGLSNYTVAEIEGFIVRAENDGLVMPGAVEALYNLISRRVETELLPLLRKHKISFEAYSPLASGFFSNISRDAPPPAGGHFDPSTFNGQFNQAWFFKDDLFTAAERIRALGLPPNAIALRWLRHHSALGDGDAILIGYSNIAQLDENLKFLEQGPLPTEVVQSLDEIWAGITTAAPEFAM
ncbi:NADP-dependent oxidoreductase domain-containing protein [Limtongia smithiae]|uniref:NADP-dependent oxidoreductase domain-containing protein n=1 Tax=Limtongia smithiae TaxID=1125753 RepID=UPI0034CF47A8